MASISIKNLAEAIYESSCDKDGKSLDTIIENTVIYLRDKNLLGKSDELLKILEKIINKEEGVIKAQVSTSSKIKKDLQNEIEAFIKKKYQAKEVIVELKEDPKLLGGVKIEIGDEIIDTTLSNKIHQLQNYLITN
jgi:F-type H+-transporting ATPase subunit delta